MSSRPSRINWSAAGKFHISPVFWRPLFHRGSFAGLLAARQVVFAWMEANGYRSSGPACEVYLHFDERHAANQDSPEHITQVQVPVSKA